MTRMTDWAPGAGTSLCKPELHSDSGANLKGRNSFLKAESLQCHWVFMWISTEDIPMEFRWIELLGTMMEPFFHGFSSGMSHLFIAAAIFSGWDAGPRWCVAGWCLPNLHRFDESLDLWLQLIQSNIVKLWLVEGWGFNPSEKYESQLGWWNSQYCRWKNTKCSKPPSRWQCVISLLWLFECCRWIKHLINIPSIQLWWFHYFICSLNIRGDTWFWRQVADQPSSGVVGIEPQGINSTLS